MKTKSSILNLLAVAALLTTPPSVLAHGGEEEHMGGRGEMSGATKEHEHAAEMARQPARVLAQQALAVLEVKHDKIQARERLDAATKSRDKSDVGVAQLSQADAALDSGDQARAIELLNRALGAGPEPTEAMGHGPSGAALHNAGTSFQPANDTQEVVAGILGVALLVLGGTLLRADRRRPA